MKLYKGLLSLFILSCQSSGALTKFQCHLIQFGETLPLRTYLVKEKFKKDCGELCAQEQTLRYSQGTPPLFPADWIEFSRNFNAQLSSPVAKAKFPGTELRPLKRHVQFDSQLNVHIFETRYVQYKHFGFEIDLDCSRGDQCRGGFSSVGKNSQNPFATAELLDLPALKNGWVRQRLRLHLKGPGLEDGRFGVKNSSVELVFGSREPHRLIARVHKESVDHGQGFNLPVSGSAEVELTPELKTLKLDVGADEHFLFFTDKNTKVMKRLASIEFKLECLQTSSESHWIQAPDLVKKPITRRLRRADFF